MAAHGRTNCHPHHREDHPGALPMCRTVIPCEDDSQRRRALPVSGGRAIARSTGMVFAASCAMPQFRQRHEELGAVVPFPSPGMGRLSNMPDAPPPRLLDRVRAALRTRHYSIRTEKAYVGWVRRYVLFHGKRHPDKLGEAEIGAYLSSLANLSKVSASTQNQALAALLFLYQEVLGRKVEWLGDLVHAKRPARVPIVLGRDEAPRSASRTRTPSSLVVCPWSCGSIVMSTRIS
jgi:hypothetical protein